MEKVTSFFNKVSNTVSGSSSNSNNVTGASSSSAADTISNFAGGQNDTMCPSLSFKTRVTACCCCLGIGMILSVFSWICVFLADYVLFGVFFTIGNIMSIGGFMFLAGPMRQLKSMFNEGRWIATMVYLLSMVLTIVVAVVLNSGILVIICCLVQFCAMWWYFLSYIPFARTAIRGAVNTILA